MAAYIHSPVNVYLNCQIESIIALNLYLFSVCSPQVPSSLFFAYNDQLGPPYYVIVDTNFVNFSIKNKLDIFQSMIDCLYAKCMSQSIPTSLILLPFPSLGVPHITDCVAGELEKLGTKFRVAQKCVPLSLYLH